MNQESEQSRVEIATLATSKKSKKKKKKLLQLISENQEAKSLPADFHM